jgi:hypothetical protein
MSIQNKTLNDYDYRFFSTLIEENGISKLSEKCLSDFTKCINVINLLITKQVFENKPVNEYIINYIKEFYEISENTYEFYKNNLIFSNNRNNRNNPNNILSRDFNTETEINYIYYKDGYLLNNAIEFNKNGHCSHISKIKIDNMSELFYRIVFYYNIDLTKYGINYVKLRIPVYIIEDIYTAAIIRLPYLVTNNINVSFVIQSLNSKNQSQNINGNIIVYGFNYKHESTCSNNVNVNVNAIDIVESSYINLSKENSIFNFYYYIKNSDKSEKSDKLTTCTCNVNIPLLINKDESLDFHFYTKLPFKSIKSVKLDLLNIDNIISNVHLYTGKVLISDKIFENGIITYNKKSDNVFYIYIKFTEEFIKDYNEIVKKIIPVNKSQLYIDVCYYDNIK